MKLNEIKWVLLYSAHVHPKNAHAGGGGIIKATSKSIEAVPAEDSNLGRGMPTLRCNH
jgi:hypothetical protein